MELRECADDHSHCLSPSILGSGESDSLSWLARRLLFWRLSLDHTGSVITPDAKPIIEILAGNVSIEPFTKFY